MSDSQDNDPTLPPERRLAERALSLPPGEREAFVREQAGGDAQFADRALALVRRAIGVDEMLDRYRDSGDLPARIGSYVILEKLGEGGMGTVYLAEQQHPVRRRVALKLTRFGLVSDELRARFDLERQMLAVMNHEAIAKVFDAGTTPDGQPYFVMELVEGRPLTSYCDEQRLTLRERIELFQKVCAGVQHAHQKGVLHRDLKPGNVLVSRQGDAHVPKVIDFGVARLVDRQPGGQPLQTREGEVLGTPEYMSPEQAEGRIDELDTRTDVYSLGAMLYELLCGELPLVSEQLRAANIAEIQRAIREDEPPKPSARLEETSQRQTTLAAARCTSVAGLRHAVRGDLDWITLKALAKEPEQRYASATALVQDLERHLLHEPVLAGPPTAGYRLSKLLRRYRVQATAVAAVMLSLVIGLIAFFVQYREADKQARIADQERKDALVQKAHALQQRDRADERVRDMHKMANLLLRDVCQSVGDLEGATATQRLVAETGFHYLEVLQGDAGADDQLLADVAKGYDTIARLEVLRDPARAIACCERAELIYDQLIESDPRGVGAAAVADRRRLRGLRASVLQTLGRTAEALALFGEVREEIETLLAMHPDDVELRHTHSNQLCAEGYLLMNESRLAEAVELLATAAREFAELAERPDCPLHVVRKMCLLQPLLATLYHSLERPADAEQALRDGEQCVAKLLGAVPGDAEGLRIQAELKGMIQRRENVDRGDDRVERATTVAERALELARKDPDDATLLFDAVCKCGERAFVSKDGRIDEMLEWLQKGHALNGQLVEASPTNRFFLDQRAVLSEDLSYLQRCRMNFGAAEGAIRVAHEIRVTGAEGLRAADADSSRTLAADLLVAQTLVLLAHVQLDADRVDDASESLATVFEQLLDAPKQGRIAVVHAGLKTYAFVLSGRTKLVEESRLRPARRDGARRCFELAQEWLDKVGERPAPSYPFRLPERALLQSWIARGLARSSEPGSPSGLEVRERALLGELDEQRDHRFLFEIGCLQLALADEQFRAGAPDPAQKAYARAIATLHELAEKPGHRQAARWLGVALRCASSCDLHAGREAQAADRARVAVSMLAPVFAEHRDMPSVRLDLARAHRAAIDAATAIGGSAAAVAWQAATEHVDRECDHEVATADELVVLARLYRDVPETAGRDRGADRRKALQVFGRACKQQPEDLDRIPLLFEHASLANELGEHELLEAILVEGERCLASVPADTSESRQVKHDWTERFTSLRSDR